MASENLLNSHLASTSPLSASSSQGSDFEILLQKRGNISNSGELSEDPWDPQ
jgi:hypothetical protein